MAKTKQSQINVQGTAISIVAQKEEDYICLTDIARYKNKDRVRRSYSQLVKKS